LTPGENEAQKFRRNISIGPDTQVDEPLHLKSKTHRGDEGRPTRWIGLAVIALPCMLYSMDLTVLDLHCRLSPEPLEPSSAELLWIVDIYGFLLLAFDSRWVAGDRIGRRRLL